MNIDRIYHPHTVWEEVGYNMWGSVDNRALYLDMAIKVTGDADLYGQWMMEVAKKWKYSCEHNLSNLTQNRKAWIGHAACAYAFRCPEDIVRCAWSFLSEEQQIAANYAAQAAINYWESQQCQR